MNIHYSSGSSIALHMIALALLMDCNPIYVTGVKLDYRVRYAKSLNPSTTLSPWVLNTDFDPHKEQILKVFKNEES
jgi:hypothetical protein